MTVWSEVAFEDHRELRSLKAQLRDLEEAAHVANLGHILDAVVEDLSDMGMVEPPTSKPLEAQVAYFRELVSSTWSELDALGVEVI